MFKSLKNLLPSKNDRELTRYGKTVDIINEFEPAIQKLTDTELAAKTEEFKKRLEGGESLDDLLPEAFACVREAAVRTLEMRHYDVQLIGGMVLHEGKIAEMATGEGKTLAATLPCYLNALTGKGVHVVTVNDYLARRDAEWMGAVYSKLGMTVGSILHDISNDERQAAYASDITYGTNNEYGFDYLRDNMKFRIEDMGQKHHAFAIVDEVDSILIDEARTPLIISGPSEESTDKYYASNQVVMKLKAGRDYEVKEEDRAAMLTEEGIQRCQEIVGIDNLFDPVNIEILHAINQALHAHGLHKIDVDYMIKDGQIVIVDEFTGRLMPGRRWSDGLHQAVEAKEGVKIESENQTIATITFQNYFRMYDKLSGMTGTAATEAVEFAKIYDLDVMVMPPNRPLQRYNMPDVVYRTEKEKFKAVADEIEQLHEKGQPVLVGTISIEKSERLHDLLKRRGIPHDVLNAKQHVREADIVAQAGRKGSVTIATNMAGRGTDILLGGNPEALAKNECPPDSEDPQWEARYEASLEKFKAQCKAEQAEVISLGGLHVLGTERHESRRVDNQLRGRSGRQGDPGSAHFFLSLDDDLMRIFGSDKISGIMEKLGMEEGVPIEHGMITKSIERAQKKVEGKNFEIRKHLLEYDDVMNTQRQGVYSLRKEVLGREDNSAFIMELARDLMDRLVDKYLSEEIHPSEWDVEGFETDAFAQFGHHIESKQWFREDKLSIEEARDRLWSELEERYNAKVELIGVEAMRYHEKVVLLHFIDSNWKDHLLAMDYLKEGIGLRGYGQRDPLVEYKRESFDIFLIMQDRIREQIAHYLFLLEPKKREGEGRRPARPLRQDDSRYIYQSGGNTASSTEGRKPYKARQSKVGRNEPCPCGSGKKYKKCHGGAKAA